MLKQIINEALDTHVRTVNISGIIIKHLIFANDIDRLTGSESELNSLIRKIDFTSRAYGMEINATNND